MTKQGLYLHNKTQSSRPEFLRTKLENQEKQLACWNNVHLTIRCKHLLKNNHLSYLMNF